MMSIQLEMLQAPGAGPGQEPAEEQKPLELILMGMGSQQSLTKGLGSPGWEGAAWVQCLGWQLQEGK